MYVSRPPSPGRGFTWPLLTMAMVPAVPGTLWCGAEFYGPPEYNSLVLVERYLEKYPEDTNKIILAVKGGVNYQAGKIVGSPENTRRSIDDSTAQLKGRTKMDLFGYGRRDRNVPLEVSLGVVDQEYVQPGKLGGLLLSEVRAETIHEAVKHTRVLGVEVELSLYVSYKPFDQSFRWSY